MKNPRHIHTPDDGRGFRDTFVNGELVGGVVYADEKKGFVRVVTNPIKYNKLRRHVITKKIKGEVVVRRHAEVRE